MSAGPAGRDNPYESPSRLDAAAAPQNFRVMAVIIGWLAYIASAVIAGVLFAVVAVVAMMINGNALHAEDMTAAIKDQPWLMPIANLGAGLCAIIGGYVAARLARHEELKYALAMGLLTTIVGLALTMVLDKETPTAMDFALHAASIPCALLGGLIRRATKKKSPAEATAG